MSRFQLLEVARRFLLVGLFVVGPAERGSVMQLATATMLCLMFLAIQAFAQPYTQLSDDLLAIMSSFSLLVFFLACLVLKYNMVTEVGELHKRMSIEMQTDYLIRPLMITYIMIGCVLSTLVMATIIFVVQAGVEARRRRMEERAGKARRLRCKETGDEVLAPSVADDAFHLFLSHVYALPRWRGSMLRMSCSLTLACMLAGGAPAKTKCVSSSSGCSR